MAMRRSFRPRRRFTRRRTFHRRPGFARQKFDKIVLMNNLQPGPVPASGDFTSLTGNAFCGPFETGSCGRKIAPHQCGPDTNCGTGNIPEPGTPVPCQCCTTQMQFVLVNNDTLQSYFQDSVTIVRMSGDIWFRSLVATPFGGEYCSLTGPNLRAFNDIYTSSYAEHFVWSLRKHERTQGADESLALDPASPMFNYDWTESSPPWLWVRNKMWFPHHVRQIGGMSQDSVIGVCADTEQAGFVVPPTVTGNNPGWIVPPVTTNCTPTVTGEAGACPVVNWGYTTQEPPWHHLRIRSRKHIKMVRDQDLMLNMDVRHPQLTNLGGWPCIDPAVLPAFARLGDVSYQVFIRIAATVRLN